MADRQLESFADVAAGEIAAPALARERRRAVEGHRRWTETDGREGHRADLRGADLRGAHLDRCRLRGTRLEGARGPAASWE